VPKSTETPRDAANLISLRINKIAYSKFLENKNVSVLFGWHIAKMCL